MIYGYDDGLRKKYGERLKFRAMSLHTANLQHFIIGSDGLIDLLGLPNGPQMITDLFDLRKWGKGTVQMRLARINAPTMNVYHELGDWMDAVPGRITQPAGLEIVHTQKEQVSFTMGTLPDDTTMIVGRRHPQRNKSGRPS